MTNQELDRLSEVLQKINELARKAAGGDYVFRGEPKCYKRVSSSLYRKCTETMAENFDVTIVQEEILKEAKRFIRETDEDTILEQLQHFGYPTNQIDFTKDYHIALFFACDSQPEKNGRVILLNRVGRDDLRDPKTPENRVIAQKSVFLRPSEGFVEPDDTVVIPKELKRPILEYLERGTGVNASAVFNDIHGFITYYTLHESALVEVYAGVTHARKSEYDKAIERFTKAIEIDPHLSTAFYYRGLANMRQGDKDTAIQDYDRAIELDPSSAQIYSERGIAFRRQGDPELAILDFTRAIELNPDYARAYYERGVVYQQQGNDEHAIQDFTRAIELNADYALAYYHRGLTYRQQGNIDSAIQDYDRAIDLNPYSAQIYNSRGIVSTHQGNYNRAIQDFNKVIELNSDHNRAYFNRGLAYRYQGNPQLAIQDFRRAIELAPSYSLAHYNCGLSSLCEQEWANAGLYLSNAQSLGFDMVSAFCDDYGSVADFEQKHGVPLPENIKTLLTPKQ